LEKPRIKKFIFFKNKEKMFLNKSLWRRITLRSSERFFSSGEIIVQFIFMFFFSNINVSIAIEFIHDNYW